MQKLLINPAIITALLFVFLLPPATAAPGTQAAACYDIYTVQANDWLSKIAEKYLGDIDAYPAIINATNQQHQQDDTFPQIANADVIEAGWRLCIPEPTEAEVIIAENPPPDVAPPPLPDGVPPEYTLDTFLQEYPFSPEVNPQWVVSTPEKVQKYDISAEMQAIDDTYGYRANYFWNENLGDDYFLYSRIFDAVPAEVRVYPAPWDSVLPRYRYPPNVTLPTGLTTNQFGWRGSQIELQKPDNTIRIAALGASTTVGGHSLPFSYPEFLQHWLNIWAQENGYNVKFEVINAGREGLNTNDIVKVLQYELLPMDLDYVIFYEGSNQFHPETVVSFPAEFTMGKPPAGLVPNLNNVDSEDKSILDRLSEYSAIVARARSIVEMFLVTGQEPPKPDQTFFLPDGQDEMNPSREFVRNALDLRRIQNDLDAIHQDAEANSIKMVMTTFNWFVYDGMVLDPQRHRNLYSYINRVYWPITYANMRRAADYQNRVFKQWAADNRVPIIDVAGQMPKNPDLFDDAIHNTYLGSRIRAWVIFESLVPMLKQDIEKGALPRPARLNYSEHPYIKADDYMRPLPPPN
jgi:LysM repeat protein